MMTSEQLAEAVEKIAEQSNQFDEAVCRYAVSNGLSPTQLRTCHQNTSGGHKMWLERVDEKDRRIKVAGFNGCKKAKEGLYCQSCVAQATNYTYSGEQDRRKSQHIYKRHLPDVNFEYWYTKNCTVDLDLTSAKIGWQAAQAALMPALVEARDALARASKCQFQRYYQRNDGSSYLAGDDDAEYFVKETLARINSVIGDKK